MSTIKKSPAPPPHVRDAIEELRGLVRWARDSGMTSSANSAFKALKVLERELSK